MVGNDGQPDAMKKLLKITCLVLILMLVTNILPAAAAGAASDSRQTYLKIGIGGAVVVGAVVLIRTLVVNNKAAGLERAGDAFATEGRWDLAVQSYLEATGLKPRSKDLAGKLENAKLEAARMFLRKGDKARGAEQFEAAEEFYQQALQHNPASTEARQRLTELSMELVGVYLRRGLSYETVNRWPEALREYEKAYLLAPDNAEVANRYQIARARARSGLPLKAILFFVNRTGTPGVENLLTHELQLQLRAQARGAYAVLDQGKVDSILKEQAAALSSTFDEALAVDLGRILDVDEVIIGSIDAVEVKKRTQVQITAKILLVPSGRLVKEVKAFTYTFPAGINPDNWFPAFPGLAAELAKRLNQ